MDKASEHRLIRKLLVLPLLPAEHMRPAFDQLSASQQQRSDSMNTLLTYVCDTWLENDVWPVSSLSVFRQQVRTNNDVEGWHRRLNQQARRGALPFYVLVKLLHEEASVVSLSVRLLSEGRLRRYARSKYTTVNGRLQSLWDKFQAGERSTSSLLRACARMQLPIGWLALSELDFRLIFG